METIGKIIATEKQPSTIEDFTFWTKKDLKLKPFDVVAVEHIQNSKLIISIILIVTNIWRKVCF